MKKLSLNRETLTNLQAAETTEVRGGQLPNTAACPKSVQSGCCTIVSRYKTWCATCA